MIVFEKVSGKNFLSVGNIPLVFNLNTKKKTLISGQNGKGKSVFCDMIVFALYGVSYRKINKSELVNLHNKKNCVVELEMTVNGVKYRVTRGIAPNGFTIDQDGKPINRQASMADLQKWFEDNVIKMNIQTFKQVCILGSADYTPFMKLTAEQRRKVSEQLTNTQIISDMNKLLKEKATILAASISQERTKRDMLEGNLRKLESLIGETIDKKNNQLAGMIKQGTDLTQKKVDVMEKIATLPTQADVQLAMRQRQDIETTIRTTEHEIRTLRTRSSFFEQDKCPQCEQQIDGEHASHIINNMETDIQERDIKLASLRTELDQHTKLLQILNAKDQLRQNHQTEVVRINTQLETLRSQVVALRKDISSSKDASGNMVSQQTTETKTEIGMCEKNLEILFNEQSLQEVAGKLLKDDGIKATIIKQYIPLLNSSIAKYLKELEFPHKFEFDANFEDVISGGSLSLSYNALSMGQRQRVDLAMLFAWRDVARSKARADTNLLIFDEILDSSLDLDGADSLLVILTRLLKNSSVFIISHSEKFVDKLDDAIKIDMVGGFTKIV